MNKQDLERFRQIAVQQGWEIREVAELPEENGDKRVKPEHLIKLPIIVTMREIQILVEAEIGTLSMGYHYNPPTHEPPESEYLWLRG